MKAIDTFILIAILSLLLAGRACFLKHSFRKLGFIPVFLFLFTSCSALFDDYSASNSQKAYIRVSVEENARTVLPSAITTADMTDIVLSGVSGDNEIHKTAETLSAL